MKGYREKDVESHLSKWGTKDLEFTKTGNENMFFMFNLR